MKRLKRYPWKTSSVPQIVNENLPKLIWIIASRERGRLLHLVDSGELNPLLRSGSDSAYAIPLAIGTAGSAALAAIGGPIERAPESYEAFLPNVLETADMLPVAADPEMMEKWLVQLIGGPKSFQYSSSSDFSVSDFWIFLAIAAAAARKQHWRLSDITDLYRQMKMIFEHGRVPN